MDWFQNTLTGAVFYNSNLHQGAENSMAEGWQWMGEDEMFKKGKYDIDNSDWMLALNNGGDFQFKVNNPLNKYDDEMVVSMLLEGTNAERFMDKMGFEQQPIQQTIWSLDPYIEFNSAPINPKIDISINEKYAYLKKGAVETGKGAIIPVWIEHTTSGTETVSRYVINYSNDYRVKLYLGFLKIFTAQGSDPIKEWVKYGNNIDLINRFKRRYGTK